MSTQTHYEVHFSVADNPIHWFGMAPRKLSRIKCVHVETDKEKAIEYYNKRCAKPQKILEVITKTTKREIYSNAATERI